MSDSVASTDKPIVRIGALVIRADSRNGFRSGPWVSLFECPVELSRLAKAALLDLAWAAARTREGLLVGSVSDIRAPRSSAHRAVSELCKAGLVYRLRGRLYLNPAILYAGPVQRHEGAINTWIKLTEENEQ